MTSFLIISAIFENLLDSLVYDSVVALDRKLGGVALDYCLELVPAQALEAVVAVAVVILLRLVLRGILSENEENIVVHDKHGVRADGELLNLFKEALGIGIRAFFYKLELIRDYIGGPGPFGHSHDFSCECGEEEEHEH